MYARRKKQAREGNRRWAVPLVDSKAACLAQEDVKTGIHGREIVDLSTLENVAEAPLIVERAELEGDAGRRGDSPRRQGI